MRNGTIDMHPDHIFQHFSVPEKKVSFLYEVAKSLLKNYYTMSRQLKLGSISPILDSLPRASNRSAWRLETGVILEMLARFINHHISP